MHSQTRQGPPTLGLLRNIRFTCPYRKELASVSLAREKFRDAAHESKLDQDILDRAELCLSELTGNAVRHACDPRTKRRIWVESTIRRRCRRLFLEVSVWDIDRCTVPSLPDPATAGLRLLDLPEDAVSGRGLLLVALQSDEIGVDLGPHGKRVWCRWAL